MKGVVKFIIMSAGIVALGAIAPTINDNLSNKLSSTSSSSLSSVPTAKIDERSVGSVSRPQGKSLSTNLEAGSWLSARDEKSESTQNKDLGCYEERFEPKIEVSYSEHCARDTGPVNEWAVMGVVRVCRDGSRTILSKGAGGKTICTGPTRDERVASYRKELEVIYREQPVANKYSLVETCFRPDLGHYGQLDDDCKARWREREDLLRFGYSLACIDNCYDSLSNAFMPYSKKMDTCRASCKK